MSNEKYEITDIVHEEFPFLHRIRALQDIGEDVKAGDLGGFVENECNLSTEDDTSWLYDDAISAGHALVDQDACLHDRAIACHQAYVSQGAVLSGDAMAGDYAYIRGAVLTGHARAAGNSLVLNGKTGAPVLAGSSVVYGKVLGNVRLLGKAVVLGGEEIDHDHADTLILDGPNRAILSDPQRNQLVPSVPHAPAAKKPRQREQAR